MVRPRSHEQDGFALIEVVVSAALVVAISIGVLAAFDSATRASGDLRNRSAASTLAQQELERLRVLKPATLSGMVGNPTTSTKTLGATTYTVASTATWQDDRASTPTCGGNPSAARYLQVSTSVTWNNMGGTPPVRNSSLVRMAPSGGAITVDVNDHAGAAVAGLTVTVTGGPNNVNLTGTTSSSGCVEWDYLPAGSYTASVTPQTGWLDPNGANPPPAQTTTIADGSTDTVTFNYDQAGTVPVTFYSKIGSNLYANQTADRVTFGQSGMSSGSVSFGTSGTRVASITASLYPFSGAYSVYAGDCSAEDPQTWFQSRQTVTVTKGTSTPVPGRNSGDPTGVQLPALDLTVQNSGGAAQDNATVVITQQASGSCPAYRYPAMTTGVDPVQTTLHGRLPAPGLPFGVYTLCAQYGGRSHTTTNFWLWTYSVSATLKIASTDPTTPC